MDFEEYEKKKVKDENRIWKAFYIALIIHMVVFLAQWNTVTIEAVTEDPDDPITIIMPPIPPQVTEPEIPRQRTVYRPIPDPEPEMIRFDYGILEIYPEDIFERGFDEIEEYNIDEILPRQYVYYDDQVNIPPVKIAGQAPVYPEIARAVRIEGNISVSFIIGIDGEVRDAQVLRMSRSISGAFEDYFIKAVYEALDTYRYNPARHQDITVPVRMNVIFYFNLR